MRVLPIAIGLGVLAIGAVAMAASNESPQLTPKQQALNAIATGDANTIRSRAISLNNIDATVAGGLNRCAMFIDSLKSIPADVGGSVVASIRGLNPAQMKVQALAISQKYAPQAAELSVFADFVTWLQTNTAAPPAPKVSAGAGSGTVALPPAVPVTVSPDLANQVATQAEKTIPAAVVAVNDRVLAAIQTGNPAAMRAEATKLRAEGYPNEAAALEAAASAYEAAQAVGLPAPAIPPIAVPTSLPKIPLPAPSAQLPIPQAPAPTDAASAARVLAGKVALAMRTAIKGKNEPRDLVTQFQIAERLPRTDGSYGSETALALAQRYGIVPPKPLYWGVKNGSYQTLVDDKNRYKLALAKLGSTDPQRADEWAAAAKV